MRVTHDETAMSMVLYNGYSYSEVQEKNPGSPDKKHPFRKDVFKEQTLVVSLSGFDLERTEINLFKSNSAMKNITQLTHEIDSLNKRYTDRVNTFYSEFNQSLLYNQRNYSVKTTNQQSSSATPSRPVFDAKVLFDSLTVLDKKTVLTSAIGHLKSASNFLSTQNRITS